MADAAIKIAAPSVQAVALYEIGDALAFGRHCRFHDLRQRGNVLVVGENRNIHRGFMGVDAVKRFQNFQILKAHVPVGARRSERGTNRVRVKNRAE